MGKSENKSWLSRRGFLKTTAAVAAVGTMYGCDTSGSDVSYAIDDNSGVDKQDLTGMQAFYGSGNHNCGGRCVSKAYVKNGRIMRITSDEEDFVGGVYQDPESYNNTQSRSCSRCRSYKTRIYHPGRLSYPLKQVKKRGDLTGFVRISWEQALSEIAMKYKAIRSEYGDESIYNIYAFGSDSKLQGASTCLPLNFIGGVSDYRFDYSYHQAEFLNYLGFLEGYVDHSGYLSVRSSVTAGDVAGVVKNVVLWGTNSLTTRNPEANCIIQTYKAVADRGGDVIFIGPEFVDQGVTTATKWIQSKPYTDSAIVNAMIYEMIIRTFKEDGSIADEPVLDVDYLDTMVYGFFDSPGYWIDDNGNITNVGDESTNPGYSYRWINPVPAGRSLSAYIMGNDDRLTKAIYGGNYIANKFSTVQPKRNGATCSYAITKGADTEYNRKKDYNVPKSATWAEKITGVPADTIVELAKLYAKKENHPIYTEYSGGLAKQAEGVISLFSLETLLIVTKTFGLCGEKLSSSYDRLGAMNSGPVQESEQMPNINIVRSTPMKSPGSAVASVAMWHNGIKFAFGDKLKENGYTGKYIPDFKEIGDGKVYHDDGGTKALIKLKRDSFGVPIIDANGYYEYEADNSGKPKYSGYRFIFNPGGNIPVNQHMNSNDSREMFECLPMVDDINDPEYRHSFCMVTFDNFMSASARWSDYVLPAATLWEQDNMEEVRFGSRVIMPAVSTPPGESKSTWNFAIDFIKAYERIDGSLSGLALDYSGGDVNHTQIIDKFKKAYYDAANNNTLGDKFVGKSFEEALKVQYQAKKPLSVADTTTTGDPYTVKRTPLRETLDIYLAGAKDQPFYKNVRTPGNLVYGADYPTGSVMPNESGRLHVYTDRIPWQYENRFKAWHKYLLEENRGQKNMDMEGDPIALPIAMYFNYEDYFMEAYGGRDKLPQKPLLLTTTHNRYRSHSSFGETPFLREMTHRVIGGKAYSGNDSASYARSDIKANGIPRLNAAIAAKDIKHASWTEILINDEDAAERGIVDGDLVLVKNPIGAVRAIAKVTKRCVKGMTGLHQGCWYDPDPVDGVDDGGNCNTLMASKPSRLDHGNGQQSAMVSITKINWR